MGEKMTCAECGMPCDAGEYHPFAACLMFKGCHNSRTVRENLATPAQTVDVEAVREVIATLDCVGSAGSDYHSSEYLQDAINDASDKLSQAIGDKT